MAFALAASQPWLAVAAATVLGGIWLVGLAVYRLLLHPLAKFPGPRLAALTTLYEGYYDVVHKGRYLWQIERMHQTYGPIVRIGPNELHVLDPSYYNTLYNMSNRFDKYQYFYSMLGIADATFPCISADVHKLRRQSLTPFFTVKSIQAFHPQLQALSERLYERMLECEKSGQPIPLFHAYRCVTVDVISQFIFGKPLGLIEREDWGHSFYESWRALWDMSPLIRQLPWLMKVLMGLPRSVTAIISPQALEVIDMQAQVDDWTKEALIADSHLSADEKKKPASILASLARSEVLPQEEKTFKRLSIEANNLLAAGFETTGAVLTHLTFMVLANPKVHQTLLEELNDAIPDPNDIPSYQVLEKLPYLTACIKETLRSSVGAYSRLPRVTNKPLAYGDLDIPEGTAIGMSALFVAHNPSVFPDPDRFIPERWLDPTEAARLDRYLLAYGKGVRDCIGRLLANAELCSVVATIFRRLGNRIELYETTQEDVEGYHDYFAGMVRWGPGRHGLRVVIKKE